MRGGDEFNLRSKTRILVFSPWKGAGPRCPLELVGKDFVRDSERGVLAQFRHQHFLLFVIAHFHKAALLMFSEHLVEALRQLDIRSTPSVKNFKRAIRASFERFLRFTHRYWFHEISEQA